MRTFDVNEIRDDLLDDDKGYFCCRGMISTDEADAYLAECRQFFETGPRSPDKIFHPGCADYVQPWMWDEDAGEYFNYRVNQFFHNTHSAPTQSIFDRICSLRNEVESAWPNAAYYERAGLRDFVIVTRYMPNIGYYPRHADDTSGHAYPLIQCLLLLTEPGVDFQGGDLTLYTRSGATVHAQADLGYTKGDCLFFDKRLEHEVQPTSPIEGGDDRWAAIVGVKAVYRQAQPA